MARDAARSLLTLGLPGCLTVFGSARLVAQDSNSGLAPVEVRLVSAGGQPITGGMVRVWTRSAEAPPDTSGRAISIPDGVDTVVLQLSAAAAHRIEGRARGHRLRIVELSSGTLPRRLRIVLSVDPYVLPVLRATGRRSAPYLMGRSARHVSFDSESLTYATLGEWLTDITGVTLGSRGSGSGQVLSIRGSRAEDVLVLLDGVSLNDPLTGRADLSGISTSTLESATLVRGVSSARLGSGASAGALLLSSRLVTGSEAGASLLLETPGGLGVNAHAGIGSGDRRLGLSVSASRMTNEFDFENRLLPGAPVQTRRNADASSITGVATGVLGALQGTLRVASSDRGLPGRMGAGLFDRARAGDRAWAASARLEGDRGHVSGSFQARELDYRDPTLATESAQRVNEARLAGEVQPHPGLPVSLGARFTRESLRGDDIDGTPMRNALGGWIGGSLEVGSLRIDPTAAVDVAGSDFVLSPEVAVTWMASPAARAWTRVGQGFRWPTFADLHFVTQRLIRPNADLDPERITLDSELGAAGALRLGAMSVQGSTSLWYRRTESPIVWLASSVAVWSPRNLGTLVSRGLEVELALSSASGRELGWRVQTSATLEDSRVKFGTNRNPLPYAPRGAARITGEGWWREMGGRVDVRYTGARTTSIAATRRLPGFTTVDFTVSRDIASGSVDLTVLGRIENVFDRRYEITELFPEPGRRFVVRLEARRSFAGE